MRFIRKNGRIIPINDGNPKNSSSQKDKSQKTQNKISNISATQRFKEGAKLTGHLVAGFSIGEAASMGIDSAVSQVKMGNTLRRFKIRNTPIGIKAMKEGRSLILKNVKKGAVAGAVAGLLIGGGITALHTAFGPRKRPNGGMK